MGSPLFAIMRLLESKNIYFGVYRCSSDAVLIFATMVGKRIEITVDENDGVDVAIFNGNEDVQMGIEAVKDAVEYDD
jgi:hypothetical protein